MISTSSCSLRLLESTIGITHTGKPCYYVSGRENVGALQITTMPEGDEIYERPENGQVFLRKVIPRLIKQAEQQCIATSLAVLKEPFRYRMDCQKQYITFFESTAGDTAREMEEVGRHWRPDYMENIVRVSRFLPVLRFKLVDKKKRQYHAQCFCFLGGIDNGISLKGLGDLKALASQYIPVLGADAFSWSPVDQVNEATHKTRVFKTYDEQ